MSRALAREIYPGAADALDQFADLLAGEALSRGLIGPNEIPRLWERHIVNCALVEELIPEGSRIVDIGSGAGLPGLVLALVRPDLQVTLVDTQARRVKFLDEAIERLNLSSNCSATQARVPEYWGQSGTQVDFVVARGLAPLEQLIDWTWPALEKGAILLAIKGQGASREVQALRKSRGAWLAKCHVELVACGSTLLKPPTTVIRVSRR